MVEKTIEYSLFLYRAQLQCIIDLQASSHQWNEHLKLFVL